LGSERSRARGRRGGHSERSSYGRQGDGHEENWT
jgi:hypothetical protein